MAITESWFKQDLKEPVKRRYITGNFFSLDNVGNLVGVKVYDNGAEATLSGSVTGYCALADGTTVPVTGTRSGNKVYILLPQSALSIPGYIGIVLKLTDGNTITTLLSIIATVYPSQTDEVVTPSQQVITDWAQQINAALQNVVDASAAQDIKISNLKSAVANVVESAAPYVISNVTDFVADDWELGGINATGGEFDATYIMRTKSFYPYNQNCTYTWAGRTSDATVRWTFFYDSGFNFIARDNSIVLPVRTDAAYLRFAYGYASNSGVTIDSTIKATLAAAFGFDVTPSNDIIAKGRNNLRIDDDLVICNHSAIVFETAKTYLGVAFDPNNRLAYSEGIGLFQPNVRNESNLKCISCSQFVQAILSGISYEFSRYVLNVNEPAEWGFLSGYFGEAMTDYGDYLTANEMGLFFDSRNQLRELNPASPQAKVGDLLLFNDGENFYHCAICTGITTERVYFLHASDKGSMFPEGLPRLVDGEQAGVFIRYLPWESRYAPTHFVSINDIITDSIPVSIKRIVHDAEAKAGSYSSASTFIKSITKDFDAGLYTIKIEDTGSGDSRYYVRLNYYKEDGSVPATSEEAKYSESIEFIQKQNTFKAIFYAQLPIRRIDIRCVDGSTYSFKSMQMFDNAINY